MSIPFFAGVLNVAGILQIGGGIILCLQLWPGHAEAGYRWLALAYTPALTWLFAGLLSGLFSFAAGAVLTYLNGIHKNTLMLESRLSDIASCLKRSSDACQ